ncbi:hypothetical protein [Corallococcus llansteffanensis]|uniref:Gingipain domain-containing protein n=1 Tax=Corallococcus llansteffanensis TaxID=2316731 RepID=A0A3A8QCL3_9BACT|nr:hypothetical protein [Corallococcus llansteffanensis]RKH66377.1 hypothetical protein D7V93_04520 [Corallococcus llansteffanensis]
MPEPVKDDALQLLLARADDRRPVLEEGLPAESTRDAPRPALLRRAEGTLESPDANPNDLAAQRWGVIAPLGTAGDAMLRAIEPLLQHRAQEQGAPVMRYRVPLGMDADAAVRWKESVHRAEDVPEEERPKYLLLLGDLPDVSIELQHVLAHGAFVGRLHVGLPDGEPDLAGYTSYADKVVAAEKRGAPPEAPDMLLYTARDGTTATTSGHKLLVEPCLQVMETRWKAKRPALKVQEVPYAFAGSEALLEAAAEARSAVMLTVAHGMGRPSKGWASAQEQRAMQGALTLGGGPPLTGALLRDTPFLPGGMWFSVACFGAATPADSAFHAWLAQIAKAGGFAGRPASVLHSLPRAGERPFVAALPQALLANPRGPLGIIGHSDLAWTLGFLDTEDMTRSRASRVLSALQVLSNGSRAGVALDALMSAYRSVNDALLEGYRARQDAQLYGVPDPVDPKRQGYQWMLCNDLRGYLLLGDPAARLSGQQP